MDRELRQASKRSTAGSLLHDPVGSMGLAYIYLLFINYEKYKDEHIHIAKYTIDIDAFGQQINFTT